MKLVGGDPILVTGADGFIGSHLVEALVGRGCRVRALVLYNAVNGWGWLDHAADDVKRSIEVVAGDVRDPASMMRAVEGCEVVLHLAALIAIPYSYAAPQSYVDVNITGTVNVLQAARAHGVKKIVHTSTSEVYGTARRVPIDEDHPLQGQSPYAATKIGADQIALSFHRAYGQPIAVIRPFNTFGPRQSARAVIPTIIGQIAEGHGPVRLGALHPTRDFCYVRDTVSGFIAIAESDAAIGEVINIGTGHEIGIGDLVNIIANVMGANVAVEREEARLRPALSEVERLCADVGKAERLFGWRPCFAGPDGFRRGLEETVAWYREPANLRLFKTGHYNL